MKQHLENQLYKLNSMEVFDDFSYELFKALEMAVTRIDALQKQIDELKGKAND